MLGLEKGAVVLVPHNEEWHRLFDEEEARLRAVAGEFIEAVEHVGSTSICGIAAKPILDIAIAVRDRESAERCVAPLEAAGYEYRGEYGIAGRFYFVKGAPRTHHVHMYPTGSDALHNHLAFRDHLRRNAAAAARYNRLKEDLARRFPNDRNAYLDGKDEFIQQILRLAR